MTLNSGNANTRHAIAFSLDDTATPLNPDKFYFDGMRGRLSPSWAMAVPVGMLRSSCH